MKAVVIHAPGDIRYQEVPLSSLNSNEVRVAVRAAGICSTDLGRALGGKAYFYPIILGHELAGEVTEVGSEVQGIEVGDHCAVAPLLPCFQCKWCERGQYSLCDNYNFLGSRTAGGFAEYVTVPSRNLVPLPSFLSFEVGALLEPTAVALHGLMRGDLKAGDRVVVMGTGTLGLIMAQLSRALGASQVIVSDVLPYRLQLGAKLGFIALPADQVFPQRIREATGGLGADIAIETAGNPQALKNCLKAVRKGGKIISLGLQQGELNIDQELAQRVVREELSLIGSWNSYSAPFPGREWSAGVDYLARRLVLVEPLISHRFELYQASEAFALLASGADEVIKAIFIIGKGDEV